MAKLIWDATNARLYETGIKEGVLYLLDEQGAYSKGVAWNGLISISESPSGAEPTPLYANDKKYLELMSAEEFGASIEAYTYPDEFAECDGSAEIADGIAIGQQERKTFGLSYRTTIGNDTKGNDYGYKLHLIYGAKATPSEKSYSTINDNPEAITFSWDVTTTPVDVSIEGKSYKPTSTLVIDSTKVKEGVMDTILAKLHGTESEEASLPLPSEIFTLINAQG